MSTIEVHSADPSTLGELVREVIFEPYKDGPAFKLQVYSGPWGLFSTGQEKMGYRLFELPTDGYPALLFQGTDFGRAPGNTEDGNHTVVSLMGFLTLRPGDTDAEYFEGYTPEQLAFCAAHAETLGGEVQVRFCDENGRVREDAE